MSKYQELITEVNDAATKYGFVPPSEDEIFETVLTVAIRATLDKPGVAPFNTVHNGKKLCLVIMPIVGSRFTLQCIAIDADKLVSEESSPKDMGVEPASIDELKPLPERTIV